MNSAPQDVMLLGTANADGTYTGVTTDETTSAAFFPYQHDKVAIAVIGNGTISGGVVTIEEARWTSERTPYNGTWSVITTVTAADVTGGAQQIVHVSPNALFPTRVRISTAIAGGGGISAALRYQ